MRSPNHPTFNHCFKKSFLEKIFMQIHRLALKNFKCFKEVDVSFSKITLLTGENSSGKSSLIYGILAVLQSLNSQSKSFPLYLSLNGKYVNMGGYKDVSFNHSLKNDFEIHINLSEDDLNFSDIKTLWHFDKISHSPRLTQLKISSSITEINEVIQNDDLSYRVSSDYKTGIVDSADINDLFIELCEELIHYSNYGFNFISSSRVSPDRTYYQSIANNMVNNYGEGYIDQILEWNDNKSKEIYKLVSVLKDLKILYDIKPNRLSGGRFEIKVKIKSKSKWESLVDVGFGISQFLPIIVADLQLSDDSTLIMSQPEIHLHPSIQANLGDYLVKKVNEGNKGNTIFTSDSDYLPSRKISKTYIVETHSEYLLNRMRLLIVKGEIQPKDVAVYYFENSIKDGSIAHRIEFTKDGQILRG